MAAANSNTAKRYPLFCRLQQNVMGVGYIVKVDIQARVTAEIEPDGSAWIFGVNPGGIAASGKTLNEAVGDLRNTFSTVLIDMIAESKNDFEAFRALVQGFVHSTNDSAVSEWNAARQAVRTGRITLDLRKEQGDIKPMVRVTQIKPAPRHNIVPVDPAIAA